MKIVGKIWAVIYSIIFFFILTALMVASFSLNLISGNYYTDIIKSIDLKTMKAEEFGEIFKGANLEEGATVEDALIKYITAGGEIDKDLATAVVNNEKIREVLGNFIGEYMNYNITGEVPKIDKKDVEAIFNEPDVQKLLESSPEKMEIDIDKIYEQLNDLANEMVEGGGDNDDSGRSNENNISID